MELQSSWKAVALLLRLREAALDWAKHWLWLLKSGGLSPGCRAAQPHGSTTCLGHGCPIISAEKRGRRGGQQVKNKLRALLTSSNEKWSRGRRRRASKRQNSRKCLGKTVSGTLLFLVVEIKSIDSEMKRSRWWRQA